MRVWRTTDVDYIRAIVTHSKIWPHVADDSANRDTYEPILHEQVYWLAVDDLGVFLFHAHNQVLFEVHTCLLPHAWGRHSVTAARSVLGWMFAHTDARKVITHVPATNRTALAFARRAGLKDEGINRASILKGGRLLDQHLLGITKEEQLCQQQYQPQ